MNSNHFNKQTYYTLQTQIYGLLDSLRQLAPHPEQKNSMAPLSLPSHAIFQPVSENDGMLGAVVMENLLGGAFSQVANDMSAPPAFYMDFDTIGDMASEYITDRTPDTGRGKGTIALGEHKVIANDFNMANSSPAMIAFLQDLPERRRIETHIAALVRELDTQAHALHNAPAPLAA